MGRSSNHTCLLINILCAGKMAQLSLCWLLIIIVSLLLAVSARAAKPYKIYVVNKYGAWDIVCDRYTVKKDDHIWEILRRKGRLSEEDFPKFVKILKDMNPHIKDVDMIYPGQDIVIPLKEMPARGTDVKEGPRYVTIPMIPDVLYNTHEVASGECLSRIVTAKIGMAWGEIPVEYFETLKRLNPDMEDMDFIYPGQTVRIPELNTYKQSVIKPGSAPPEKELLAKAIPAPADDEIAGRARPGASAPSPVEVVPTVKEVTLPKTEGLSATKPENAALSEGSSDQTVEDAVEGAVSYTKPKAISPADIVLSEAKISELAAVPPPTIAKEEHLPVQSETEEEVHTKIARPELPVKLSVKAHTTRKKIAKLDNKKSRSIHRSRWQGFISRAAAELDGRLLSSGYCYFPGKDNEDIPLDLAAFPVVELKDGRHVLLETEIALPQALKEAVRTSWKEMVVIRAGRDAEKLEVLDKIFRGLFGSDVKKNILIPPLDDGVQVALRGDWVFSQQENKAGRPTYYSVTVIETPKEYTQVSAVKYLTKKGIRIIDILVKGDGKDKEKSVKDEDLTTAVASVDGSGQEAFISGLVSAMGYYYEPQASISFDYAGFQVETTANIVYGRGGRDVVVDFGTFYGDARSAIEKGGLKVFSIKYDDELFAVAKNLLKALECSYDESPALFAADRELSKTTSLTLPGVLISPAGGNRGLLTETSLDPKIMAFLRQKEIGVWEIRSRLPVARGQ